jgi:hypothetical protein
MNKQQIIDKFSIVTNNRNKTLMSPFVINVEKKTMFFHIAKTAGSKVHSVLRENGYDDGILSRKKLLFDEKLEYFTKVVDEWDKYYKFTFIRNKYSLLTSLWNYDQTYLRNGDATMQRASRDFGVFIREVVVPSEDVYSNWIDQHYITHLGDDCIFDFIGRQENFTDDMKTSMNAIGIHEYDSHSRVNKTRYKLMKHFTEYYDEELKALVDKKFSLEMEKFKFKMSK